MIIERYRIFEWDIGDGSEVVQVVGVQARFFFRMGEIVAGFSDGGAEPVVREER